MFGSSVPRHRRPARIPSGPRVPGRHQETGRWSRGWNGAGLNAAITLGTLRPAPEFIPGICALPSSPDPGQRPPQAPRIQYTRRAGAGPAADIGERCQAPPHQESTHQRKPPQRMAVLFTL